MKIALKITPQRSTQYAHMTAILATPEVLASPLGAMIQTLQPVTLAGQAYLLATVEDANDECLPLLQHLIPRLGAISEAHEYFEQVGDIAGPLLRPLEPQFTPFVPFEMAEARRYKGKTNETFTRVLLNAALFAGHYRSQDPTQTSQRLRILDPLSGGGTTLFLALALGYDAFGIDLGRQDVDSTAVFIRQYLASEHIHLKETDERGRHSGRRYQFEIGRKGQAHHLVLAHGNAAESAFHMREVVGGPHMHAIVGDLPYGIQHLGEVSSLLSKALPVWEEMLFPGGTVALAWNATRIEREALVALFQKHTQLQVRNDAPYTQFSHPVDRVIKKRDILVAVKA
ncbi:hypothetical protein [Dictyobacter arantiisoli]|uniref:Uncharacterized protein n=1 Tax=Dictyobacter arantiisoli TaxID=2014874 RepID=A0A5A5TC24_9CHLR|nr:hypothetical protein [Dictyobacter arantiisoli]GCF09051.1 hypothetical protein KDI_26150 [Dictyobacter arantiisoli]